MTTVTCPFGHRFRVRVLWGMPVPEAMAEAEAGRLILGGYDPEAPVTLTCPKDRQTVIVRPVLRPTDPATDRQSLGRV